MEHVEYLKCGLQFPGVTVGYLCTTNWHGCTHTFSRHSSGWSVCREPWFPVCV